MAMDSRGGQTPLRRCRIRCPLHRPDRGGEDRQPLEAQQTLPTTSMRRANTPTQVWPCRTISASRFVQSGLASIPRGTFDRFTITVPMNRAGSAHSAAGPGRRTAPSSRPQQTPINRPRPGYDLAARCGSQPLRLGLGAAHRTGVRGLRSGDGDIGHRRHPHLVDQR